VKEEIFWDCMGSKQGPNCDVIAADFRWAAPAQWTGPWIIN
jgi:hypothetical protein